MNTIQRYNLQKQAIRNNFGIENTKSDLSSLFSGDSAIDRFIITLIETRDKRRLLLDSAEMSNIFIALNKDAHKAIEKAIEDICKKIR